MSETGTVPQPNAKWVRLLPIAVFVLALLIRSLGIGWGLKNDLHNQSYHPDEPIVWVYSQQFNPAALDFTPGFYNYGTLYLTVLRVASDVTASYTGGPDEKSPDSVWSFVSRAHMAGRILSSLAGAGTVLVVFLILRRRTNEFGAIAGAFAMMLAPGHVVHSRFQTVDVLATFLLALSMLFALRLLDRQPDDDGRRDAVLAGIFAGLSAGTKYTGILGLLTLVAVLVLARRRTALREGLLGIIGALATFLIVTPGVFLESEKFMRDFRYEMAHTSTGHGLVFEGVGSGFVYHLVNLFEGFGTLSVILGFGALAYLAFRRAKWVLAVLAFSVPYYLLIGRAEVLFLRYTFPLMIGIAVGFGALVGAAHRRKGPWGIGGVVAGFVALTGAVGTGGLRGTILTTIWMSGEDPRDAAAREIRRTANDKSTVGLAQDPWFWSVPFFPDSTAIRSVPFAARMEAMRQSARPAVVLATAPDGGLPAFNPALPQNLKPDRIAMTSLEFDPYEKLVDRKDISSEAQAEGEKYKSFMQSMAEGYIIDQRFGTLTRTVEDMTYIHPLVLIWKRKDGASQ